MTATTIKIENPLLKDIKLLKPKGKSVTSFVKEMLSKSIQRIKLADAASQYVQFLESQPMERELLDDWEKADLSVSPKSQKGNP